LHVATLVALLKALVVVVDIICLSLQSLLGSWSCVVLASCGFRGRRREPIAVGAIFY
jgi:hypothetical protein